MKLILTLLLTVFSLVGLKAQSDSILKKRSFELHLGIGKIGGSGNDFVYYLNNSPTYETEYITEKGIEISSSFTTNWNFNTRHEAILGLGFNGWIRKSIVTGGDIINGWQEASVSDRRFSGQLDLMLGYRYFLIMNKDNSLFVENGFLGKMISIGKYPGVKFSIEPGIGYKFKIKDSLSLLTVVSFKQPIGNSVFNRVYGNRIGFRLGLNKTL